ncbi:MAG: PaaI family thioesterase [Alphaproteobacteria bacterium]|nr:PaaI family thioesterase [Alphaproteobacteria bacterium]
MAIRGHAAVPSLRKIAQSFARQGFMKHLGVRIHRVGHGTTELRMKRRPSLLQQHGYFHGGVIATLADVAGGYAAFSHMGNEDSVLTVEFKLNLIAPGDGDELRARGHVIRSGRTLTVTRVDVFVVKDGHEVMCATALQTLIRMAGRPDGPKKGTAKKILKRKDKP